MPKDGQQIALDLIGELSEPKPGTGNTDERGTRQWPDIPRPGYPGTAVQGEQDMATGSRPHLGQSRDNDRHEHRED